MSAEQPKLQDLSENELYSSRKYVPRWETALAEEHMAQHVRGELGFEFRSFCFYGSSGAGMTWTLEHLKEQSLQLGMRTVSMDLGVLTPNAARESIFNTWIHKNPEEKLGLFVDNIYAYNSNDSHIVEDGGLRELSKDPNVFIVMAGRGKNPFDAYGLRYGVGYEKLTNFSREQTRRFLVNTRKFYKDTQVEELHELSDGNPLALQLLTTMDNPETAISRMVDRFLDGVDPYTRQLALAMSIFDRFGETEMTLMLPIVDGVPREVRLKEIREARHRLQSAELLDHVNSDSHRLKNRNILERGLKYGFSAEFDSYHEQAQLMYKTLAEEYIVRNPNLALYYADKSLHHGHELARHQLKLSGGKPFKI